MVLLNLNDKMRFVHSKAGRSQVSPTHNIKIKSLYVIKTKM